jgi:hypothetical protein
MVERMNVQIAAWCQIYWKDTDPSADRFYCKLSDRAFSQVLLHEISECTWDSSLMAVTSPSAQSEMSAIAEFKQQDWVWSLSQDNQSRPTKKKHGNPNVAFPFQDNFSVRTFHCATIAPANSLTAPAASETIKIPKDNNDISILTMETSAKAGNSPFEEKNPTKPMVRKWIATGPD